MVEIASARVDVIARFSPDIPRIQILELPAEQEGEYYRTPFVIVVDGLSPDDRASYEQAFTGFKEATGASATLMLEGRIQV